MFWLNKPDFLAGDSVGNSHAASIKTPGRCCQKHAGEFPPSSTSKHLVQVAPKRPGSRWNDPGETGNLHVLCRHLTNMTPPPWSPLISQWEHSAHVGCIYSTPHHMQLLKYVQKCHMCDVLILFICCGLQNGTLYTIFLRGGVTRKFQKLFTELRCKVIWVHACRFILYLHKQLLVETRWHAAASGGQPRLTRRSHMSQVGERRLTAWKCHQRSDEDLRDVGRLSGGWRGGSPILDCLPGRASPRRTHFPARRRCRTAVLSCCGLCRDLSSRLLWHLSQLFWTRPRSLPSKALTPVSLWDW